MKKIVLITALIALVGLAWGQSNMGPWILIGDQNNVKIYRSYSTCNGDLAVMLRVENSNSIPVAVSFNSAFNLSGSILPINLPKQYVVAAKETIGGDCSAGDMKINPNNYVTTIQIGVSDYIIQNLKIVQL